MFGVGDDDQVIYGYAGADPGFLIDFPRYFPGAATYDLQVNYRCPPAVVAAARTLLAHNRRRIDKTIRRRPAGRTQAGAPRSSGARARRRPHQAAPRPVGGRALGARRGRRPPTWPC